MFDWSILLAVLGFGFVIFIHELGHFLFAKAAGVKVLRFAIGFNPIVWTRRIGETEYSLGLLPLGGYVKMLGEEGEEDGGDPRSFARASRGWRALILLGGVTFNLVSSWLILICLAWYGMPLTRPMVGDVIHEFSDPDHPEVRIQTPAHQLGLRIGDVIEEINGERTLSYDDIFTGVAKAGDQPLRLVVRRKDERLVLGEGRDIRPVRDPARGVPSLGITSPSGLWLAAVLDNAGALHDGAPLAGWTLETIDGESLAGGIGQQAELVLKRRVGEPVTLGFRRPDGAYHQTTVVYAGTSSPMDLAIGLPVRVSDQPKPGTPAGDAGLNAGDVISAINGTAVAGQAHFISLVQNAANAADGSMRLTVWSPGAAAAHEVPVTAARDVDGVMRLQLPHETVDSGWLPVLPNALGGDANGLASRGMQPGDTLLDLQDATVDRTARTVGARLLSGGSVELIALARPADLSTRALKQLRKLYAHRVDSISGSGADAVLRLADLPDQGTNVALAALPDSARDAVCALKQGDWIVRPQRMIDGRIAIEVVRGAGLAKTIAVPLRDVGIALQFELDKTPYRLAGWTEAFTLANHQTKKMVVDTLSIIPKFFRPARSGGIDATKSLSGPIGIFGALRGMFERFGFAAFLQLVALIGLNLFLVNLLPIPVVDGGQLAFLAIEAVMRRPLPMIVKSVATGVGVVLIASLMLFVLSLDVLRLGGWL